MSRFPPPPTRPQPGQKFQELLQLVRMNQVSYVKIRLFQSVDLAVTTDAWGKYPVHYSRSPEMTQLLREYMELGRKSRREQHKELQKRAHEIALEQTKLAKQHEAEMLRKKLGAPTLIFEDIPSSASEALLALDEPTEAVPVVPDIPIAGFERELLLGVDQTHQQASAFQLDDSDFPSLGGPRPKEKFHKPSSENLKSLAGPATNQPKKPKSKGKGKGKIDLNQAAAQVPEEVAEEYGFGIYTGEEHQWVVDDFGGDMNEQEGVVSWNGSHVSELDFEDDVSFVGSESSVVVVDKEGSSDWEALSEASQISFSVGDFDDPNEAQVPEEGASGAPPLPKFSFANALKQNLGEQKVAIRPPRLPPSTFLQPEFSQGKPHDEDDGDFDLDSTSPKEVDRKFGRHNKPLNGGKSAWKPPKANNSKSKRLHF